MLKSELFDVAEERVDKNNNCEFFKPKAELVSR